MAAMTRARHARYAAIFLLALLNLVAVLAVILVVCRIGSRSFCANRSKSPGLVNMDPETAFQQCMELGTEQTLMQVSRPSAPVLEGVLTYSRIPPPPAVVRNVPLRMVFSPQQAVAIRKRRELNKGHVNILPPVYEVPEHEE